MCIRDRVQSDLGCISDQDDCHQLYLTANSYWEEELKKPKEQRSLWKCLWRTVTYKRVFFAIILYGVFAVCSFIPIIIQTELVKYFLGAKDFSTNTLWLMVSCLFIVPTIGSICSAQNNVIMSHIGNQVRNMLISFIYRKSLRLSSASVSYTHLTLPTICSV